MQNMKLDIGKGKASKPRERFIPNPKLKLLDELSEALQALLTANRAHAGPPDFTAYRIHSDAPSLWCPA